MARTATARTPLVTVTIKESGLEQLTDIETMAQAEAEIIEAGVEIIEPIARASAPHRTGRGARFIRGVIERQASGHLIGRISPIGKGFYLRILATGRRGTTIEPRRFTTRSGRSRKRPLRTGARALLIPGLGFRRRVSIPPRGPDPFLERAAREGAPRLTAVADVIIARRLGGRVA